MTILKEISQEFNNLKRKHSKKEKESMTVEHGKCYFIFRFSLISKKSTYLPTHPRSLDFSVKKRKS